MTHTREIHEQPRLITYRYLSVDLSRNFFWAIAEMFYVLHIVQSLPPVQAGIIFSMQFLLIGILDFPTGGLADSLGHRTVLMIAHVMRVLFFVFLILASSFWLFVVANLIFAISLSQESGALETWYDLNYKYSIKDIDKERIHYTAIKGRLTTLRTIIVASMYILGGYLANLYNRELLFGLSAGGFILVFVLDFVILQPTPEEAAGPRKKTTTNLLNGLRFTVSSKMHAVLFTGLGIVFGSGIVWYVYLLFQTYEAYSGSNDFFAGLLRTIIFLIGIPLSIIGTRLSRSMVDTKKWLTITYIIGSVVFFVAIYFLFQFFPPADTLILSRYILLIVVFTTFGGIWFTLNEILTQRFTLDFYPDDIRNSLFSFLSSIGFIIAIPIQLLVSSLVERYSLQVGILTVGLIGLVGVILFVGGLYGLEPIEVETPVMDDENGYAGLTT